MTVCIVNGCNTNTRNDKSVGTVKLPLDSKLREKWLKSINRIDHKPTYQSSVCLKHFHISDFVPDSENLDSHGRRRKKRRLQPYAIPRLDVEFSNDDPLDVPKTDIQSVEDSSMDMVEPLPVSKISKPFKIKLAKQSYNPWDVMDASVFLKYCCPECDYMNVNLPDFEAHALKHHVLAITLFNSENVDNQFEVSNVKNEYQVHVKQEPHTDRNIKVEQISSDGKFHSFTIFKRDAN